MRKSIPNEIAKHLHNNETVYGSNSGFMSSSYIAPFVVTGGNDAWGTELHIHDGTVIESGSTIKKFDLGTLTITAVSTADIVNEVEFLYGTAGADIIGTVAQTDGVSSIFTRVSGDPMVVNGDKVIITALTTLTGVSTTNVYYVVGVAASAFQIATTLGGTAIILTGATGTYAFTVKKLTQTVLTQKCVTNKGYIQLKTPRVTCNNRLFVRARSTSGSTIGISFILDLHTYAS